MPHYQIELFLNPGGLLGRYCSRHIFALSSASMASSISRLIMDRSPDVIIPSSRILATTLITSAVSDIMSDVCFARVPLHVLLFFNRIKYPPQAVASFFMTRAGRPILIIPQNTGIEGMALYL